MKITSSHFKPICSNFLDNSWFAFTLISFATSEYSKSLSLSCNSGPCCTPGFEQLICFFPLIYSGNIQCSLRIMLGFHHLAFTSFGWYEWIPHLSDGPSSPSHGVGNMLISSNQDWAADMIDVTVLDSILRNNWFWI